jgi:hypothetical protein
MTVMFSLTQEDFRLFQRAAALRVRAVHGRLGVPFLLQVFAWACVGLSATAYFRLWQQEPEAARPFGALGLILLVAFLAAVALPYAAQWSFKRHAVVPGGAFLAPQTVELTAGGLVFTSAVARSELNWQSVLGRVEDHRNHYLFIDTVHAVVVPKTVAMELGEAFTAKLLTIEHPV